MASDSDPADEGLASERALPNLFGTGGVISEKSLDAEDADEQAVDARLAGRDRLDEADRRQ